MLAASLCIIFALCCPVVHADPVSVDISSAFDWSRELLARCVLSEGDYRIVLAGRSVPGGETGANEARVLAGLSSSWIRIGPLSPAGVLREACNPLGFQAGSDVFVQRSGFVVDSSFPAQSAGALVMPIARSLGAFYRQLPDGGEWVGCMASAFQRQGASLEGFISLARPPCESMGEEWIADSAPFAGGRILTSAARILAESRPFGMTATLGASLPETSLPGGFFNLHLWARTEGLKLFFLLSKADSTYISPSGDHSPDAGSVSAALLLDDAGGSADVRFSRSVRQLPFAPHSFLAGRTEAGFRAEKSLATAADALFSVRVEGGRIIHEDPEGARDASARCSAAASFRISPVSLESGIACSDIDGLSVKLTAGSVMDRRGSRVAFEADAFHLDGGMQAFSTLFSLRFARKSFSLALQAGLADVRFLAVQEDLRKGLRLSLQWVSHSP